MVLAVAVEVPVAATIAGAVPVAGAAIDAMGTAAVVPVRAISVDRLANVTEATESLATAAAAAAVVAVEV